MNAPRPKAARAVRCAECGKFIADTDLERSRFEHEPLNEFGPEVSEWVCFRHMEQAR